MDMNQVSLYNKYRPACFNEIVGQGPIVQVLANAVKNDRVANAYLFRGSKGSGKTSTARILCKATNCHEFKALGDLCGKCAGCLDALKDAIEIDAASNRGAEDIAELIEQLKYLPKSVDVKFIIIDEAHQLTATALNSLLKVVEEPPHHIKFIFCTTKELVSVAAIEKNGTLTDKAFMTLASRCQIFRFSKIADEGILDKLRVICSQENININEDTLLSIVGRSSGSLRDAENLLDSVFSFEGDDAISLLYGDTSILSAQLLRNCCLGTISDSLMSVTQLWDAGGAPNEIAEDILNFILDVFQIRFGLTVYRPSAIVGIIKEISENVEQNRIESIAVAFNTLKNSNLDSILSLELAVCGAMASSIAGSDTVKPLSPALELESDRGIPDATIW
jgi:DNA polymerase-3 subunit gamma/tau